MEYGTVPFVTKPVSRIVCGTDWLVGTPTEVSWAALDAYWELGGRCFDSAEIYGDNAALFGDWVHDRGHLDEVVFFDKGCHPKDGRNRVTFEDMGADIATEHARLRVDFTDFFVLHRDDEDVPVGEIVEWLNHYRQQGLIGAFGGSNWRVERIAAANAYAAEHGLQPFSVDNPNLTLAHAGEPLWPGCVTIDEAGRAWHEREQFPLFSWASMARGYFAHTQDPDVLRSYDNPTSRARRERAERMAAERGVSTMTIAMAWVLAQPFPVFALAGLRTAEQAADTLAALELELSPDDLRVLEHGD